MNKLLPFSIFLLTACSTSNDTAIHNLESILTHQFSSPNSTLLSKLNTNKLERYLEVLYPEYFTEDMYQLFIQDYATKYHQATYDKGYKIDTTNINIVMNDDNTYDFVLQLLVYDINIVSVEHNATVTGRVHFSVDYQISDVVFYNDEELVDILDKRLILCNLFLFLANNNISRRDI